MFFYKLRKVIRENWLELMRSSSVLSFIASFVPFFPFLFLYSDDFTARDKKQMFIVSSICVLINLTIIYFIDKIFCYNIIFSIFIGGFFSFLLYLIPLLILLVWFEITELQLDKSEIREAKINSLFRKLF